MAETAQVRALCQIFLARLFESESTAGRSDPRDTFFWIVAALATPGLLLPIYQQFHWYDVANRFGLGAMATYALFDKTAYLTWTFVAIGFLSAIVWPGLLLERRDGWILGSLPVRSRSVILGKVGALASYIGLISAGMHAGSSLLFGWLLGSQGGWPRTLRGIAAHFIASFGLSCFVFLAVTTLAALALAVAGPRHFSRISAILQLTLVGVVTSAVLLLPSLAKTGQALGGGSGATPWMINTPPIWFLGLYETIDNGTSFIMRDLGTMALGSLGATLAIAFAAFPIAGLRAMRSVASELGPAPRGWTRPLSAISTRTMGRTPPAQGAVQFALATFGRVNGHRLVLTVAFGLALVVVVPAALLWIPREFVSRPAGRSVALLAVPMVLMYFGQAGLRVALALPSSLPARWLFSAAPTSMFFGREAARGLLIGVGVLPAVFAAAIAWSVMWNPLVSLPYAVMTGLAGWLLAEIHLWGFVGPPCAQPLSPGSANLQARWPAYFIGLLLFCVQLPYVESIATTLPVLFIAIPAVLLVALVVIRRGGQEAAWVNAVTGDPQGLLMLDLSAPQRKSAPAPRTDYSPHTPVEERPPHA